MKIICCFIFLFLSCSLMGQDYFLEKTGRIYTYKGKTYKCSELTSVYSNHYESLDLYNSGRGYKKTGSYFALFGFVTGLGGVGVITYGNSLNTRISGGLVLGGSIIVELIGLVILAKGSSKLRRARDLFNSEMLEKHGYKSDTSLSLGFTTNGIGLVYAF